MLAIARVYALKKRENGHGNRVRRCHATLRHGRSRKGKVVPTHRDDDGGRRSINRYKKLRITTKEFDILLIFFHNSIARYDAPN